MLVLLVDGLITTGGTYAACDKLIVNCEGKVGGYLSIFVNLAQKDGRSFKVSLFVVNTKVKELYWITKGYSVFFD